MQILPDFLALIKSVAFRNHLEIVVVSILDWIIYIQKIGDIGPFEQHLTLLDSLRNFFVFQFIDNATLVFAFIRSLEFLAFLLNVDLEDPILI